MFLYFLLAIPAWWWIVNLVANYPDKALEISKLRIDRPVRATTYMVFVLIWPILSYVIYKIMTDDKMFSKFKEIIENDTFDDE
jgi:hypothetical protein